VQISRVQAKAFIRFDGWFSHQAANASRWAFHFIHAAKQMIGLACVRFIDILSNEFTGRPKEIISAY
jgi:hypothetical protein